MKLPDLSLMCLIVMLIIGCASLSKIEPDKSGRNRVSASENEWVWFWNFKDYMERFGSSKGWEKPKPNNNGSQWLWIGIAGVCATLSIASFVVAYVTAPCHKAIGVGAILGTFAVVATGISAIVGWIGWIVGAALVCGLIWAGVRLRNWSFTKWMRQ
jgi:hypothetical protein